MHFRLLAFFAATARALSPSSQRIIQAAAADGIDLLALNFTTAALASIDAIGNSTGVGNVTLPDAAAYRIDVHVHAVPDWYRALVPLTGGSPTPAWDVATHLAFMNSLNISHGVLSISSPGSTVFPGDSAASVGIARLLNEWLATLVRTYPDKFSFLAVIPLPYTNASITEANYAVKKLGAIGLGLLSNHEGYYLGNATFKPFFEAVNSAGKQTVIFIHPNSPCEHFDGQLISADPTVYTPGLVEFFFETGRTVMDLVVTGTLQNFTNIRYQLPHVGGALPSILDRFLSIAPLIPQTSNVYDILAERVWWDSAGPTYPHQVLGLLAYGVGKEQLVYGTDYPYAQYSYNAALARMLGSAFLNEEELQAIFRDDSFALYGNKLAHS